MVSHRLLTVFSLSILLFMAVLALPVNAQQGSDQDKLEQGARLYEENCRMCHGDRGEGRVGATLSKNWPSIRPDLRIKATIENGVPGSPMPAWSVAKGGPLSAEEIEALVAYILSWETGEPLVIPTQAPVTQRPTLAPLPEVKGDPNRGAILFDENCAVCHGADGQGRVGATLARTWGAIRPDLSIKTVIQNGVAGSAMPAWSQAKGGPLTESDVDDLVAFVLSLKPIASAPGAAPTEAETGPGLSGAAGILLTIALFALIASVILFAQRKSANEGS